MGVLVLSMLLLALAAPGASPNPAPTNPFTLDPLPRATTLPVIGTTRSRPVCTAIRRAVKPALEAAMQNDATYLVIRKNIYDYVVRDFDQSRDLHLMQMDRKVDDLVKSTDALETALQDPSFQPAGTVRPEDAKALHDMHDTLKGVLAAQRVQLDVMSGFVETERARRFGKLDESQQAMQDAIAPTLQTTGVPLPTITGFLNDESSVFSSLKHPTVNGLADGHKLDHDLGDIAAFTARRETVATRTIVDAANHCR